MFVPPHRGLRRFCSFIRVVNKNHIEGRTEFRILDFQIFESKDTSSYSRIDLKDNSLRH